MLPQNTHSVVWIVALMFTALSYILCQAFSFLSFGEGNAIFTSSTGNISDVYTTEITPAGWTFSIWGVIYIFNACWLIHLFSTICRTSRNGGPVYNNPTIVSVVFLVVYTVNMLLNVSWLLLWDRTLFEVSLVILVLITLTLYICLVDYHVRINHFVKIMATQHKSGSYSFPCLASKWRLHIRNVVHHSNALEFDDCVDLSSRPVADGGMYYCLIYTRR
ncbi:hypothetical protein HOLleu_24356 [Holothuria leucospilota]|uniref:Uncharacterized protein n=1 Tax=Holothuria leucospilota TaxID=206669 RepID=A0A9Q1H689_HOLLE|nr:hypothetical protein HOLleu_24356 [Holothuria leucospilota]